MRLDVQLEIKPYEGIAGILFGMTRDQVRSLLNTPVRTFRKTPQDAIETDAFDALGIHVFYKRSDICEAIELASPANPVFQGKSLISQPFSHLLHWLRERDPDLETDETGLTSYQFGIGLYAPFAEVSPAAPVEGVIVFERDYYDT